MLNIKEIESWDAERVCQLEEEARERLKTAKLVTQYEDGRKLFRIADGGFMMRSPGKKENAVYGVAYKCEGEFNEENLAIAKEKAVERTLDIVRDVINTVPDKFFVIHDTERIKDGYRNPPIASNKIPDEEIDAINYFTVAIKMMLPNVYEDKEDIYD